MVKGIQLCFPESHRVRLSLCLFLKGLRVIRWAADRGLPKATVGHLLLFCGLEALLHLEQVGDAEGSPVATSIYACTRMHTCMCMCVWTKYAAKYPRPGAFLSHSPAHTKNTPESGTACILGLDARCMESSQSQLCVRPWLFLIIAVKDGHKGAACCVGVSVLAAQGFLAEDDTPFTILPNDSVLDRGSREPCDPADNSGPTTLPSWPSFCALQGPCRCPPLPRSSPASPGCHRLAMSQLLDPWFML